MSVLIFILGAIVGSFLNVLIVRTWEGAEIVRTPSHCPHCRRALAWHELIPIVSFFTLRARCKTCKAPISLQYPLVELATGATFLLLFNKFFAGFAFVSILQLALYFAFASLLIVMFVFDWKYLVIPDRFLYPAVVLALIIALRDGDPFLAHALSAGVAGGIFALMVWVSRERAMGAGDIFIALIMGLVLGWPSILAAMILAFFAGAGIGVFVMLAQRKNMKMQIPFGPFLIGALMVAWVWGPSLVELYLSILGLS